MNWLTDFVRPKIRALVQPKEVPENLWVKCPSCETMLFRKDLEANLQVCTNCGHHLRFGLEERLKHIFDGGVYKVIPPVKVASDPLKFKDQKRYTDRLKEAHSKTGKTEATETVQGTIGSQPVICVAFNFDYMGGSMGMGVGESIVQAAEKAVASRSGLLIITASGGARMQEGMLSLMQMVRTTIAVQQMREAGLPYVVLFTDPTTGGVSASFAMIGDIHIGESGAQIGFAGKRVIKETIRQDLPEGFQTAEYLRDHGMVDIVAHRKDIPSTLARVFNLLLAHKVEPSREVVVVGDAPKTALAMA